MTEDGHLTEQEIELFAAGRDAGAEGEAHAAFCESCVRAIGEARTLAGELRAVMREASVEPALDVMIAKALTGARAPRAEARDAAALRWAGVVGAAVATVLAVVSGVPSIAAVVSLLVGLPMRIVRLSGALDRVVTVAVPGGWSAMALALCLGLATTLLALQWIVGMERRVPVSVVSLLSGALLGVAVLGGATPARALELEGAWPMNDRRVTIAVDNVPLDEALRRVAGAAGLDLVASFPPGDRRVTVHVRRAVLRDVLVAALGDAPLVVRREGRFLIVRAAESPGVVRPAAEALPVPPPPAPPSPLTPLPPAAAPSPPPASGTAVPPARTTPAGNPESRVTFGNDAVVREGERVDSVVTMGGDAEIRGEVLGDVVTMGGDAEIRGEVLGDVVTMGGDIDVKRTAVVRGDLVAMGGDVDVEDGAGVRGTRVRMGKGWDVNLFPGHDRAESESEASHGSTHARLRGGSEDSSVASTLLRYAVLFFVGLVLLGLAPDRMAALRSAIRSRPLRAGAAGAAGFFAAVLLCVLLAITLIGIPAAIVAAFALAVAIIVGYVAAAMSLGGVLPLGFLRERPVLQLAVGVLCLAALSLIPVVGALVALVAGALGLGAVVMTRFRAAQPI